MKKYLLVSAILLDMFFHLINPMSWIGAYRTWRNRQRRASVSDFAFKHKHLLVIVLDPIEDTMFMAHRGRQVLSQIKYPDGKSHHIVKDVIKASQFKHYIDKVIEALVEALKTPLINPAVNQFVQWVDGALFNISKTVTEDKIEKEKAKINKQ